MQKELILRYTNRKLYSKTLSRYVSLNYVLDRNTVQGDIQVLDYKTKEDITKRVLLRAEFEQKMKGLK